MEATTKSQATDEGSDEWTRYFDAIVERRRRLARMLQEKLDRDSTLTAIDVGTAVEQVAASSNTDIAEVHHVMCLLATNRSSVA